MSSNPLTDAAIAKSLADVEARLGRPLTATEIELHRFGFADGAIYAIERNIVESAPS